ncbi:MAG: hypothetical protein ACREMK_06365 [Gemmatimonadota bacterium]
MSDEEREEEREEERIDLGALGPTGAERQRAIAEIMRRARPELSRRAVGVTSLAEWRRWRRPAFSAAALLAAAAIAALVLVDVGPAAEAGPHVADVVLPSAAQRLLERPEPPVFDDLLGVPEEGA